MGRRRVGAAVAGLVLLLGTVTACTGDDSDPTPSVQDTDPGRPLETMRADGLPEAFPRDEVPLVSGGEVTSVQTHGDQGYDVTIVVDQVAAQAVPRAVGLLERAGWDVVNGSDPTVKVLRKDDGQVILTGDADEARTSLGYTITLG